MKIRYYFLLSFVVLLFTNCNELNPEGKDEVRDFVKAWNGLHSPIKAVNLKYEYLDVVNYYGAELTKEQVQLDKSRLFVNTPEITIALVPNSMKIEKDGKDYLVSFKRAVTHQGETTEYASYLSVLHKNSEFKILREGLEQEGVEINKTTKIFPTQQSLEATYKKSPRLYGDFNGDGIAEYAFVTLPIISTPATQSTPAVCEGDCNSVINFSDPEIKSITVKGVYNYSVENVKDLNGDLADELGFFSITPTTKTLHIIDATTGNLLTEPIIINTTVHKNLKLIDILKKTGPKKITVTESVQVNGIWKLKSRVVVLE